MLEDIKRSVIENKIKKRATLPNHTIPREYVIANTDPKVSGAGILQRFLEQYGKNNKQ